MERTDPNHPLARLRHHVTGAVERGEAQPIVARAHKVELEVRAVCSCGWKSERTRTGQHAERDALALDFAQHARACREQVRP